MTEHLFQKAEENPVPTRARTGARIVSGIGLTPRQAELLRFIESYIAANGQAPSIREMGRALGYAESNLTAPTSQLLCCLEEKGRIRRLHSRALALDIIQPIAKPQLRVVFGPGHFEDRARINRARYVLEGIAS